jgi:hypothetical protein
MADNIVFLFQELRVFEKTNTKTKEIEFRFIADSAFRFADDPNDYLCVAFGDEEATEYPVDIEDTIIDEKTGDITFSVYDGEYILRKLTPEDGKWLSRFQIDLPVKALEYLLAPSKEERPNMSQEMLVAYSKEESTGVVFGVEYINTNLGSFVRTNGMWMLLSRDDETFEDMYATFIDPEKADEFLADYDKGGMTVEQADTYADPNEQTEAEAE